MLAILAGILAFNYVDRLALGLLLQDIKAELSLSDTQLGILSGIAFALFYSVMGIPIARWADRGNRVTIIALTTGVWSAAVALCAAAGSFAQLMLLRVGVAVGEAGCIPPAHSLIADHFNRSERPKAVAMYMLGAPASMVVGYFGAGWLNQLYGWRTTFILMGLPGIAVAILVKFTLREPRQRKFIDVPLALPEPDSAAPPPGLLEVLRLLWSSLTFRHLLFSFATASFFGYGLLQWQPTFFVRSHGLQTGELGTWFAIIWGGGGLLGTYLGGELASRYAARNEHLQLVAMAVANCGFGILSACVYLSASLPLAFLSMGLAIVGVFAVNGPLFATLQSLVPVRMRAVSIALVYLFANLIGMGLGPLAAGALSDSFQSWAAEESLRYALLALCPGYLWVAWHLRQASKTVAQDLLAV